jgi:hypothetical protein
MGLPLSSSRSRNDTKVNLWLSKLLTQTTPTAIRAQTSASRTNARAATLPLPFPPLPRPAIQHRVKEVRTTALGLASKISHIIASSHPPPRQKPLTAPTMGFRKEEIWDQVARKSVR